MENIPNQSSLIIHYKPSNSYKMHMDGVGEAS